MNQSSKNIRIRPALLGLILAGWAGAATAIEFEDVTTVAGISGKSRSYGACWGDVNGDGWLDLYAGNHSDAHSLYVNQQDGSFAEVHDTVMPFDKRDAHGCAWVDFDRDGDQDMVLLSGGNGGRDIIENNFNQFYVNDGGTFTDQAGSFGLEFGAARARTPLWFDYDRDGLLDLILTHVLAPDGTGESVIMRQTAGGFTDVSAQVGFQLNRTVRFAQLADLTGDGVLDLLVWQGPGGLRVFDIQTVPFQDISGTISGSGFSSGRDVVLADFDGDLRVDFYSTAGKTGGGEVLQPNPKQLRMGFGTADGSSSTVRFATVGDIAVQLQGSFLNLSEVSVGASGSRPSGWNFSLSPGIGLPSFDPGVDRGIFIGHDSQADEWVFTLSDPGSAQAAGASLSAIIDSQNNIGSVQNSGFNADGVFLADNVKINTPNGIRDRSSIWLPGPKHPSAGAVAGDFDNDGDVDVYVVNSFNIANHPNTLYENVGGSFVAVANAGGAAGSTDGVGDSAVVADYDRDGFLDLYVMNGGRSPLFGNAAHQLFRNKGNANHWLQLDLVGVASNPHGIGARIVLEAGGVSQVREQGGGMHKYESDGHRVHFGLGTNTVADRITIHWPGGHVQELLDVPADQILAVVEDGSAPPPPPPPSGDALWGDTVWADLDGDGIQSTAEPGVADVAVNLYVCADASLVASTTTNANGRYTFQDLVPGDYTAEFVLPAGFVFSPDRQGTRRGRDSDADPATGFTNCRTLDAGQTRRGVDAGLIAQ